MPTENEVQYCEVTGFSLSPNSEGRIIHRDTGTPFNPSGFDHAGRDADGYDAIGFDSSGFDRDGWDSRGFDHDNLHRVTRTHYHPEDHLTWDSSPYCEDNDGLDWQGNSRCDNGVCRDDDCERCYPPDEDDDDDEEENSTWGSSSFEDCLMGYDKRAPRVHGWSTRRVMGADGYYTTDRTLYAGHEIEMYTDDEDADDVAFVLRQLDSAYARFNPQTRTTRCAIAKHDGSLDDYGSGGFETVTVPLTREQTYGIFESFKVLGNGRCSAWTRGDSVGHHIHLSRAAIGPLTLGKMLVFLNAYVNRQFIVNVAGRDGDFNSFVPGKKLTDAENGDRYEVLNVTDQTAEFRMFKSNLYSRAILKNYEFAVSTVRFCEDSPHGFEEPETETDPLSYFQYRRYVAAHHKEYPYLHAFLLTHHRLKRGYTGRSGLKPNAIPKERSPKFALIRTNDPLQTC
jgi:hypothetical protein